MAEEKKPNVAEKIQEAFKKGISKVDSFIEENTDEDREKKIADAVLDVIEEISDALPYLLDKTLDFCTSRVRKRYDIPDNDQNP